MSEFKHVVSGLLPPVMNLKETYVNANNSLLLSWDRPLSIAVPPETEPGISHEITINDGNLDRMITLSNLTYFMVSNLGCRDAYVITITPVNIVGKSQATVVQFPGTWLSSIVL